MTGITTVLFRFGGFVVVPLVHHLLIAGHSPGKPGEDCAMQITLPPQLPWW